MADAQVRQALSEPRLLWMKEPGRAHHPTVQVSQACFHILAKLFPYSTINTIYRINMQRDTYEDGLVLTRALRLWLCTVDHVCSGQNWLAQS